LEAKIGNYSVLYTQQIIEPEKKETKGMRQREGERGGREEDNRE